MGQKVHPVSYRLPVTFDWRGKWFAEKKEYINLLHEDLKVRDFVKAKLSQAAVPKIVIERAANRLRITVHTARPGIVIGRKGAEIDKLKEELHTMTGGKEIYVDIIEIKQPETDPQLISENVALQLERRISFRRAMKKAVQTALDMGAAGIKIRCAGRLGGGEIARTEWYRQGTVPLQTLRADIEYGFAEALCTYGKIGVKCWIYKGPKEKTEPRRVETPSAAPMNAEPAPAR
ncbi:MAG: 30S ribosomal protein S3 [Verrucomicrobia bacterium]|nr:30S ribosomal protein S3 [Verrucomicrobiota bacterium]